METILSFISSLVYIIYGYNIGMILFEEKHKTTLKVVLYFLLYFIFYYFIIFIMDPTYAIFFESIMLIPLIKNLFNKNMIQTVSLALIGYTYTLLFQVIISIFQNDIITHLTFNFSNYNILKLILQITSILLANILIYLQRKHVKKYLEFMSNYKYYYIILIYLFFVNVTTSFVIRFNDITFNIDAAIDSLVIIVLVVMFVYAIDRNDRLEKMNKYYNEIYEYSKLSEELNVDYQMKLHENKNQLLIIDGMVKSENEELKKYLKYLLNLHNNPIDNYYLSDLGYIPIPGVKSFINYKLMELHNIDATIELCVSDEVKEMDIACINDRDYNNITTILGVILDNIVDAVKNQKEKLVSISIFAEDDCITMQFANNYEGNLDISKIQKKGYSTKGKNRGVGLSLVEDIVSSSNVIECHPKLIDNFFMQQVLIKIPKIIKE